MSENCNNDCSSCGSDCADRQVEDFREPSHPLSRVKKVIAVVSGKGGVGKSMVTALLATGMNKAGYSTAILDADITGPSIPKAFGLNTHAKANNEGLLPVYTQNGIGVMSVNLLLENTTDPVIWRGPVLAGTVKQFWGEVIWGDVDYLFVDLPPGTGDVPLTVFQSLPIDGIVIVTTPQELVTMIVEKAVNMAKMMNIPVLALVENMSYVTCPDCGKEIPVFGKSQLENTAKTYGIKITDRLGIDPVLAASCDSGTIEKAEGSYIDNTLAFLKTLE